jgi:hypothetical protein
MKISITTNENSSITGYQSFFIKDGTLDLSSISNNECQEILLGDSLNKIEYDRLGEVLQIIVSKLRMGGRIKLFGLEPGALCRGYLTANISEADFNKTLFSLKSCVSSKSLKATLQSMGLRIETIFIQGLAYDITATR